MPVSPHEAELLDLIRDSIIIRDRNDRILFWNKSAEERYGWTKAEAISASSHSLLNTTYPLSLKSIDEMLCTSGHWEGQLHHTCRNGATVLVSSRWTLRKRAESNIDEIVEIDTDITSYVRKKIELEEVNENLEEEIEVKTGRLVDTQQALEAIEAERADVERLSSKRQEVIEALYKITTGPYSSPEDLLKRIISSIRELLKVTTVLIGKNDRGQIVPAIGSTQKSRQHDFLAAIPGSAIDQAIARKTPIQLTGQQCAELAHRDIYRGANLKSCLCVPITGVHNSVEGVIVLLDTMENTFTRDDIHVVEVYGAYLAYEFNRARLEVQLRQAEEMKMLGQLTSGVAHEVRNPINAVSSIMEALFEEIEDHRHLRPYFDRLQKQIHRLSRLMEDLLTLGRPLNAKYVKAISVGEMLQSSLESWKLAGKYAHQKVILRIPETIRKAQVKVDPSKMQQVFINLLDNAAFHHASDQPLQMNADLADHDILDIGIIDRGAGITPDRLCHVFKPFFTTRKAGSGLGLNIVRHIVESHGGTVELFNNDDGAGLTAQVKLPMQAS
ncbi:MAG: GAF domain-containing protein [Chitinivibrionales bacterium]|nr:GAF domain-containing protein [Chitinivibrionales bacterium]